ncbi:DUF5131 family protein [Corallococcus praedator]|uniref:DUF5131 family protein n=1 Tax=Corallococcus praedator TaxID=2316724 RepID=A0ABX9QDF8_9BACT|nr:MULTISPECIES: DUF5131 family protein [Corallococcus]RKH28564.1 DUF5131 family protein [Corallococcus sp. CA031C]RKI02451.1 DUF5131 family protein [Corallococcus praedator]
MGDTSIEWTDVVWNPTRGCSRVSPGCGGGTSGNRKGGCYAERMAIRLAGPGQPYEGLVKSTPAGPRWTGKVVLDAEMLAEPLRWRKPRRVFVNSMSDLFHESLHAKDIALVFAAMALARRHTFQVQESGVCRSPPGYRRGTRRRTPFTWCWTTSVPTAAMRWRCGTGYVQDVGSGFDSLYTTRPSTAVGSIRRR